MVEPLELLINMRTEFFFCVMHCILQVMQASLKCLASSRNKGNENHFTSNDSGIVADADIYQHKQNLHNLMLWGLVQAPNLHKEEEVTVKTNCHASSIRGLHVIKSGQEITFHKFWTGLLTLLSSHIIISFVFLV